jgi:hypothetical protein
MKKAFLVVLLFAVAVYGIFAQTGMIRELSGEVELKVAGSNTFVAAKVGDAVAQNTIVSTGFRSTAIIAIGSSVITVRALTRLSLAEIQSSQGTETVNVNLQAGRVRVDVTPPSGARADFSVQSTNATASVRGTSFEFDTLNLTVNEGTVAYSGASGLVTLVNAGRTNSIGTDNEPVNTTGAEGSLLPLAPVGTLTVATLAVVTQTQPAESAQPAPVAPDPAGDIGVSVQY